jgi:ATP-dependent Clp protease ATP-binding subunit ClpA
MLRNVINRVRTEHKIDLVLDASVREELRALCIADLSNGGRGIGNQLESAFVNPLARAMFRFPLAGRTSVSVTKLAPDENRIMTVELE